MRIVSNQLDRVHCQSSGSARAVQSTSHQRSSSTAQASAFSSTTFPKSSSSWHHANPVKLAYLLFTLLVLGLVQNTVQAWHYSEQDQWGREFHECAGLSQSPINIPGKGQGLAINESLSLSFNNYDQQAISFTASNTYHSVQYNYIGDGSSRPTVSGPGLNDGHYVLEQFHFHWGSVRGQGSEHTYQGQAYSMEMHLVHFNSDRYNNFAEALKSKQGVAVLGIMFQISSEPNEAMEEITRLASQLQSATNLTRQPAQHHIILSQLLPEHAEQSFYTYSGSLTTPPCTEGVHWVLFKNSILIGLDQIEVFRNVLNVGDHNQPLMDNFREVQRLHGRVVTASFDPEQEQTSGASAIYRSLDGTKLVMIVPLLASVLLSKILIL